MKYFRNAASTLSTRFAWPWRDGVHIIYVTVHFTHTNATQALLMLPCLSRQLLYLNFSASHSLFLFNTRIEDLEFTVAEAERSPEKKDKKSSSNADLYPSLSFLSLADIQTQLFTMFASSFWPYKPVSAIIQGSLPPPVGLFQSMSRHPEPCSWADPSPQEVKETNPSKRRKHIHNRTSQDWYCVLLHRHSTGFQEKKKQA